ncbi:MAG: hypothetical protein JWM74_3126 [Myxococcaceae bacterium]|nr:hypothetical protein [Myxococcaceae bacterium]
MADPSCPPSLVATSLGRMLSARLGAVVVSLLVFVAACREDKPQPVADPLPPVPAPVAPSAPTPTTSASGATPLASASAASPPDAFRDFAGFSKDGKSFAWVAASPALAELIKLQTITEGATDPTMDFADTDEGKKTAKAKLDKGGFTNVRTPAPADLTLDSELTATPPKLALVRAGKRKDVPIGKYPYPPTDVADIWGVSSDGKHVAVHIHGKDVPGLFSKGGGGTFHFYFVAAAP